MPDPSRPSRLTPPAPDEVILPLPRKMSPRDWAIRVAIWAGLGSSFILLLFVEGGLMDWRSETIGVPRGGFKLVVVGFRQFAEEMVLVAGLVAVACFDRRRWAIIGVVLLAELLAASVSHTGKLTVVRYRPFVALEAAGAADFSTLAVGDTWEGWQPINRDNPRQSFPSGHSGAAFALATALAWFYPRRRGVLYGLATGCALSRIIDGVHWPSDCLVGAAIGTAAAWVALRPYVWVLPIIAYRRLVIRRRAAKRTDP